MWFCRRLLEGSWGCLWWFFWSLLAPEVLFWSCPVQELAVFCKTSRSPDALHFVPNWMPAWSWSCFMMMAICSLAWDLSTPQVVWHSAAHSPGSLFMSKFYYELLPPAINVMMGIAIAWFSFQKLDGHKQTLDQMESFDLRNAQCTLETDRVVLQRLVQDLFDEALEPPVSVSLDAGEVSEADTDSLDPLVLKQSLQDVRHVTSYPTEEEVIGQFNAYVRGPLRDRVMSLIGREIDISLELRAVSNLPLVLLGVFLVFSCDRHSNCSGALIEGYSSVSHYILTTAVVNCVIVPLILVAFTFPLALRANHLLTLVVKGKVLRMLCGIFVSTLVLALNNAWAAAGAAGMMVIMCEPSTIGVAVYLGLGFLMCCSAWFLHPNMARTQRQPAVSVAKTFCFAG
ncbi:unnamed protein product [Durusdinium trenchii]|uniref:Uncharacterized protein n=1 Tax=Durusdinium trenchii TaxID=1381693 RepID=A0ABP0Q4U9_9DINO